MRDSQASHILLEFKYTESVNETAIRQLLGYDTFYRRAKQLPTEAVQSFIVSTRTPRPETLIRFGYGNTEQAGLYHSDNVLLQSIPLLALNELEAKPHNVFFKLFASLTQAKSAAVAGLRQWWLRCIANQVTLVNPRFIEVMVYERNTDNGNDNAGTIDRTRQNI